MFWGFFSVSTCTVSYVYGWHDNKAHLTWLDLTWIVDCVQPGFFFSKTVADWEIPKDIIAAELWQTKFKNYVLKSKLIILIDTCPKNVILAM